MTDKDPGTDPPEPDPKTKSLIEFGSGLVGGGAGGLIGFLIGGPAGAAVGGPSGAVIGKVVTDVANRTMSFFERRRVATAAVRSIQSVQERCDAGDTPREDEAFHEAPEGQRSAAQEIFEGVLLKCKNEHEEKKTRFIENIFVNITFRPDIAPEAAYSLLSIVERFTYRQICLLALLGRTQEFGVHPENLRHELQSTSFQDLPAHFLKQEIADLERQGFFNERMGSATAYLSDMGKVAFDLLGLGEIPSDDIAKVRAGLP